MKLFIKIAFLVSIMSVVNACTQEKSIDDFRKNPKEVLYTAIDCTKIKASEVLKNKNCALVAEYEKPYCEQELHVNGVIMLPNGRMASCEDKYYLLSRPIIEAKLKAYLEGQPDPVVEYLNTHKKE